MQDSNAGGTRGTRNRGAKGFMPGPRAIRGKPPGPQSRNPWKPWIGGLQLSDRIIRRWRPGLNRQQILKELPEHSSCQR
jgi:hypothetical protein